MNIKQVVEGFRKPGDPLWKWQKWKVAKSAIPFPKVLRRLHDTSIINCEFIGGKLIEVHQRHNTDMGDYEEALPVWKDEYYDLEKFGYTYYNDIYTRS